MANQRDDAHPRFSGRNRNGQFSKGFSGNPKGKPCKARSTKAIFREMLLSKVAIRIDGKVRHLTVIEAMAARVKREALTGPLRGLEKAIAVAQMYSLDDPPDHKAAQPEIDLTSLTDEELEWYGRLSAKLTGMDSEELKEAAEAETALESGQRR